MCRRRQTSGTVYAPRGSQVRVGTCGAPTTRTSSLDRTGSSFVAFAHTRKRVCVNSIKVHIFFSHFGAKRGERRVAARERSAGERRGLLGIVTDRRRPDSGRKAVQHAGTPGQLRAGNSASFAVDAERGDTSLHAHILCKGLHAHAL